MVFIKMSKRLERIKGARSISDILDVVSEIAYEFKNSAAIVKRLVSSISAEMVFDARKTTAPAKVVDATYVPPKLSDLKTHIDVVNKLYDNVLELDSAEALVKQAFAGHKKQAAALAAIKSLKSDIDNSLNDAFDALNGIAQAHQPKKFEAFADKVIGELISLLPIKAYDKLGRIVYAAPDSTDKTLIHFCEYVSIEGLKNTQGFKYDIYYVMLTGVVNKDGSMQYYINGLPDFKPPTKYPLGAEVPTIDRAKRQLALLLDHNDFVVDFEKKPLPLDTERANTSGITSLKGVESVKIENDELLVTLNPSVKTERMAETIALDVLARLNGIVGAKKNSNVFQRKLVMRGGKKTLKFILVPNMDKRADFSLQRLDEASELLGLSDKQKAALRFALQHPGVAPTRA